MWPSTHPPLAGASQSSSPHPAVLGRGHGGIGTTGTPGQEYGLTLERGVKEQHSLGRGFMPCSGFPCLCWVISGVK